MVSEYFSAVRIRNHYFIRTKTMKSLDCNLRLQGVHVVLHALKDTTATSPTGTDSSTKRDQRDN